MLFVRNTFLCAVLSLLVLGSIGLAAPTSTSSSNSVKRSGNSPIFEDGVEFVQLSRRASGAKAGAAAADASAPTVEHNQDILKAIKSYDQILAKLTATKTALADGAAKLQEKKKQLDDLISKNKAASSDVDKQIKTITKERDSLSQISTRFSSIRKDAADAVSKGKATQSDVSLDADGNGKDKGSGGDENGSGGDENGSGGDENGSGSEENDSGGDDAGSSKGKGGKGKGKGGSKGKSSKGKPSTDEEDGNAQESDENSGSDGEGQNPEEGSGNSDQESADETSE